MEKIIIGRDRNDLIEFKDRGTAFIGRHIVGEGEDSHLTNPIYMDMVRPHILLVCGKRGTGKSYTAGIISEELINLPKEIKKNLSILMIDTMGIYWSMKRPNERDSELLKKWGLKPSGINTLLFVPKNFLEEYEKVGVKVDKPFTLPCGELEPIDWIITFGFSIIDEYGILIERVIKTVRSKYNGKYCIDDIIKEIEKDRRSEQKVKDALINRFMAAKEWNIFEKEGTPVKDIFREGGVSVLDVSHFSGGSAGWSVRTMLVGLLCRKIYQERLTARKSEEFQTITGEKKKTIPMVWIIIDEAHMFLPSDGETAATQPLLTLVKQGREPGISLLLITQRPEKLHEDARAQADLIISHRLTAKPDLEALRSIMQSYMMEDIQEYINSLPREKGTAIILDDNSERIFTVKIRPRQTWHAGGSPSAIRKRKFLFE
ncbi:ATP-binding protein [bacterium]|nr:MAG: ATP-binding protein [bacterium]